MITEQINNFFNEDALQNMDGIKARLGYFSALFLGAPYMLSSLGEGEHGQFDQTPLMRFDAFDCLTYVNTVLALSFSKTPGDVKPYLLRLNYYNATPSYFNRFHFISLDWNIQNQRNGFIRDITNTICDEKGDILAEYATTEVNKASWYQKHQLSQVRRLNAKNNKEYLCLLKEKTADLLPQATSIYFLPLKKLFTAEGVPVNFIFDQVPTGAVVEIVRPAWDLREKIGTRLHVSHLGFVIRESGQLFFYHASLDQKRVSCESLSDYLHKQLEKPTIGGIAVQLVIDSA